TQGGGVSFMFPASLQGNILWNNTAADGKDISGRTDLVYEITWEGKPVSLYPVSYTAIENLKPYGTGNINLSSDNTSGENTPGFKDPERADFFNSGWSLQPTSTLIDKGLNTGMPYLSSVADMLRFYKLSHRDLVGVERIKTVRPGGYPNSFMDMGAYESDTVIALLPTNGRIYVTAIARGKMDGSSWKNSTNDLQGALNHFKGKTEKGEVWVQGDFSYVPYRLFENIDQDQRKMSFSLHSKVSLYGGFKGDPEKGEGKISEESLEERVRYDRNQNGILEDFEFRYQTILDGMINPADQKYYAYHVVYYDDPTATEAIVMDGFTVTNGIASGTTERDRNGGGIYSTAPLVVKNSILFGNTALGYGGGAYLKKSTLMNSSMGGNSSEVGGGALALYDGSVVVNTNLFNNTSELQGGGVYADGSEILNCVIARNVAHEGAGVYLQASKMTNTVVWGNKLGHQITAITPSEGSIRHSAVQDGEGMPAGNNNIRLNKLNNEFDGPRFLIPTEHSGISGYDLMADWALPSFSPLVDKGISSAYPDQYPQTIHQLQYIGIPQPIAILRKENGQIDIGSYEYKRSPLAQNLSRMYVRTWEHNSLLSDGSSWEKATSNLQGAIEAMEASTFTGIKEIWVAQGEYIPTKSATGGIDTRERSFIIEKGGINIYGGFPDDGTGLNPKIEDRNIRRYATILDGYRMDNYHVVRMEGSSAVLLDGFTIQGGKSGGSGWSLYGSGAWIQNDNAFI
ncbi:MAG: hypothetical protein RSC80_11060, partial [Odoribacter sp.]